MYIDESLHVLLVFRPSLHYKAQNNNVFSTSSWGQSLSAKTLVTKGMSLDNVALHFLIFLWGSTN